MSKQHLSAAALFLIVPMAIAACGSEDEPGPQPVKFASFNAGLATNFVLYAPERRAQVIAAIKASDADVMCLQEVWSDDDTDAVIKGVKGKFPHAFAVKTEEDPGGVELPIACTAGESDPLKACIGANCVADPNDPCSETPNLAQCGLTKCNAQITQVSTACYECLAANIGLGFEGILEACAKKGTGKFAFKARNGLIILSRNKLTDTAHTVLKSSTNRRAVLEAEVNFDGSKARVYCTHLTAGLSNVAYTGEFGSWEKEQAQQIDAVIALVDKKVGTSPAVLIGDMNCSPKVEGIEPEMEGNFKKFTDAGFKAPYVDAAGTKCTWCDDNTLHDGADVKSTTGSILDHILMKNLDDAVAKARTARIIDGLVEIEVACKKKQVHVSDHYGLSVELDPGF